MNICIECKGNYFAKKDTFMYCRFLVLKNLQSDHRTSKFLAQLIRQKITVLNLMTIFVSSLSNSVSQITHLLPALCYKQHETNLLSRQLRCYLTPCVRKAEHPNILLFTHNLLASDQYLTWDCLAILRGFEFCIIIISTNLHRKHCFVSQAIMSANVMYFHAEDLVII